MLILGNFLVTTMATLFVLTCLFMMLVILIQKPKGGGLSGAFGGAGGSAQAAFGAKTGDLLTMITIGCFVLFLGLAIGLTYAIRAEVNPKSPVVTPVTAPADTTDTPAPPTDGAVENETDTETTSTEPPAETEIEPASTPAETPAAEPSEPDAQP